MESSGFLKCIENLKQQGLFSKIKYFVSDKDGKIQSLFRSDPQFTNIVLLHDPGHFVKNVEEHLKTIFKTAQEFQSFPGKIKRWFLFCIKESETSIRRKYQIDEERSITLVEHRQEIE